MTMSTNTPNQVSPRRSSRMKRMSIKATEAVQTNNLLEQIKKSTQSFDDNSTDDEKKRKVQDNGSIPLTNSAGGDKHRCGSRKTQNKEDNQESNQYRLQNQLKQGIQEVIIIDSSDDEIFAQSDSEFAISDEESKSSASENDTNTSSAEDDDDKDTISMPVKDNVSYRLKDLSVKAEKNYIFKTDAYFENQSQKGHTSNHTLDKLNVPKLSQDQLQLLLKNVPLTDEHKKCVKNLSKNYESYFQKWLLLMNEDFNILLYGLGSKRNILHKFQADCLMNFPVIVVNGFFPSLTLKDIIDAILVDVLEIKETVGNVFEACDLIAEKCLQVCDKHLYLIIHNIEGEMLRNNKAQTVLSKLAAIKNIHLLASIDHINAPLIWDQSKLSKFKFTWWDVTTFLPYLDETSFESSMMIQKSGNLALSSLKNVYLSLTKNSKGIYLIIVKYQLENQTNQYYQGMLFKDLYWACREAFLVSSDLALRAQLTEFVDHKMVKFKRSLDGAEYLVIPIQNSLLQKFLNEQE